MTHTDAVPDESVSGPDESRILTIPNLITLLRLLCIPLFLYLLFGREARGWAAFLLAVLGATDWVDGYIARHFGQVSNLGRMFDPSVDRAMFVFGLGGIIIDGSVPLWLGLAVVGREVILSIFVVAITALGATRMDVTWFGKAGTFFLMFAFPAFLGSHEAAMPRNVQVGLEVFAWVCTVPGLVFSAIAFVGYFPMGVAALREGRAQRAAAVSGSGG